MKIDYRKFPRKNPNNLNFSHCSVLRHFSTISEAPGHGLAPEGLGGELQTLVLTLILPLQGQLEVAHGPQVSSIN
jgi:hypothetical protein